MVSELNEELIENNEYFKRTLYSLDDLQVYAIPFANVHKALMAVADGRMTNEEAVAVFHGAVEDIKSLNAKLDAENAA